jgi:metallophosphoesterase (TIGR00282 family)
MRILFIGDIVGTPGVRFVQNAVPKLRDERQIDVVIANAENATNGSGCSPAVYRQLRAAGVDLVTLGDHIYKKAEIIGMLEQDDCICKPANLPPGAPGHEFAIHYRPDGLSVAVISLLGRTFMKPVDCPFQAVDRVLARKPATLVIVDIHAEATGDKYLLARYLDGRVTAVLGTHTHVPTADEQILPGGTAFICDVGMTGPYDGILGRKYEPILSATLSNVPVPFDVASGDVRLGGALVEIDTATGRSISIERVTIRAAPESFAPRDCP